jgi:nucleotide-binding universal stress UspA family protein
MSTPLLLVVLSRPDGAAACLRVAAAAALALPDPRVVVLHVLPHPPDLILPSEEVMSEARQQAIAQEFAADSKALHAAFLAWQGGLPGAEWLEVCGVPEDEVRRHGVEAALVVMARPPSHARLIDRAAFEAGVFGTGRPLLAVPEEYTGGFGQHLAVGWADTPATRRAIEALRPWLAAAETVSVLAVGDRAEPPPPGTALDGLPARVEFRAVPITGHDDGAALVAAAIDAGADGLVIGAYRRGRLLEWMLGGVTEHVLHNATLPVLLHH